ncbi:uncharacterized protein LOC111301863 [Durio zibethinus]|uniref:Uncharacterized protein LOC111301863 n=1 Tax=Durio zibethinus TaxID=66656 RepID=A0A6P5ZM38_DURZI|nr:uncharacterized protein LOC111301863 [Durio zibethinus]
MTIGLGSGIKQAQNFSYWRKYSPCVVWLSTIVVFIYMEMLSCLHACKLTIHIDANILIKDMVSIKSSKLMFGNELFSAFSRIPGIYHISLPSRLIELFSFAPNFIPSNSPIQFQEKPSKSRHRRVAAASVDGENGVPTLTPLQTGDKKPRKQTLAAIIGGASAALLVLIILVLVYICMMRVKRFMRRTSETASAMPSPNSKSIFLTLMQKFMRLRSF